MGCWVGLIRRFGCVWGLVGREEELEVFGGGEGVWVGGKWRKEVMMVGGWGEWVGRRSGFRGGGIVGVRRL